MKTLVQIQEELEKFQGDELLAACERYLDDERKSVQQYLLRCQKRVQKEKEEINRVSLLREYECKLAKNRIFCGIDEAGRGPLAGPVVAAAVIWDRDFVLPGVNDSKKLSEKKREELYELIMEQAVSVGVGIATEQTIDEINILQATYQAMRQAVSKLSRQPELSINDAVVIPDLFAGKNQNDPLNRKKIEQIPVIKGDAKCYSIAAASIIAKVTRDRLMRDYAGLYPQYGFDENKGYGSSGHINAIREYGLCPIHRRSFVKNFI